VHIAIGASVAVSEAREGAREGARNDKEAAEELVGVVAVAIVGQEGVEELEREDRPRWEELDEVPYRRERGIPKALELGRINLGFRRACENHCLAVGAMME